MANVTIKNLIFDLGNVIIDLDFAASENLLKEIVNISFLNPGKEDLEVFLDFECGQIPEAMFLNHFLKKSRGKAQAIDFIKAWTAMLAYIPHERLLMLQSLRDQFKVLILSNTNETHIRWVDQYLDENYQIAGLSSVVDFAFYSHDLKSRKPQREIYQKMLDLAQIDPVESIFFDDYYDNIIAAEEMGIHGFHVSPQDEIIDLVPKALALYS
ncbi:MAG: HAD family phosphatase [Saprospiraceae bacterium]|nr:HAD family phosphatase [Saprospiraceae bacterium]